MTRKRKAGVKLRRNDHRSRIRSGNAALFHSELKLCKNPNLDTKEEQREHRQEICDSSKTKPPRQSELL